MAAESSTSGVAEKSAAATAASAHSRINIPLNLANWKGLETDIQRDLLWFHQHLLDSGLNFEEAKQAIGYDASNVFRILKGTYDGNYGNVCKAIRGFKRLVEGRGEIQQNRLVDNDISRQIGMALDYALHNTTITMIIGESRMGKSAGVSIWRQNNNHGTSVLVITPPYGGTKMFLRRLAESVGVARNLSVIDMYAAVCRAFNKNRILIIDEAHRLFPSDRRANPVCLELCRDIHDTTGCALAFVATERFQTDLEKGEEYQFEQLLGRIGMPVRLHRKIKRSDYLAILQQYVPRPPEKLLEEFDLMVNQRGRLGHMVETLKVASRIATKARQVLTAEHVFKAMAARRSMMGERVFAKSEHASRIVGRT